MVNTLEEVKKIEKIHSGELDESYPDNCLLLFPEYYNDSNIKLNEIIYMSLAKQFGIGNADDKFLIYKSKSVLKRTKKMLYEKGYLLKEKLDDEYIKEKTIELSHVGKVCEWCGKEAYTLHAHHYPIPKSEGGTEVVNICPNCHYTFHVIKRQNHI